ncbi:MAG: pantoate--beta-alanine ligase [Candidatus Aminicenantes bacterium RBG_19FT_COMBO_58_17]|nr:MAG: pantoate--beta-alanine ligase [Candidatus Aminicenantes bacterium RBG_19FT_COMBO_58_17]
MRTVNTIAGMKAAAIEARSKGKTIGFVPTMGYLHEGHLSLVRESRKSADVTVVSIFVNPLQFGPQEDFRRYPRDPERDAALLEKEGVDILFLPENREMYPEGYRTSVEVAGLQDKLCGRSRPGHFRGVATVVLKLFNIVRPDCAFFGQKDAQQVVILQKMVQDLNADMEIRAMPIIREPDGLAMSSRNAYLSAEERRAALVLSSSLGEARRMFENGERAAGPIRERLSSAIAAESLARIDYVEIVDPSSLEPVERIDGEALVALAVYIGKTRLIDNEILGSTRNKK